MDPYNGRPWTITTARRPCRSSSSWIGRARCAAGRQRDPPRRRSHRLRAPASIPCGRRPTSAARPAPASRHSATAAAAPSARTRAARSGGAGPRGATGDGIVQRHAAHHARRPAPLMIPDHQSQGTPSLSCSSTSDSWRTRRDHQRQPAGPMQHSGEPGGADHGSRCRAASRSAP